VEVVDFVWQDDFPAMRNRYLEEARRIDPNAWVVVADPDEWFSESFVRDLPKLVEEAESNGVGLLLINSHDITTHPDGRREETVSNFFKNLCYKLSPEVHYRGVGSGRVHETLIVPPGTKQVSLPRKYYYEHHKTMLEIWERAFRNVWIAGGGNNVGERNPRWKPLRAITDKLGLKSWPEVREYLRRGNVDKELLEWIRDCRKESGWDWQNEMFDALKYYKALHPEELPDVPPATELTLPPPTYGSPPEVMAWVERCYKEVLGRHADDRGKQVYTNLILTGKLRREDLPDVLRQSSEYREKFGIPPSPQPTEQVGVAIPVNVQVGLSEDHFVRALMQSEVYWKEIKPKLDFARKWAELTSKFEVGEAELSQEALQLAKQHISSDQHLHLLTFGLQAAKQLDELGYQTVVNASGNDPHNLPFPDGYFDGAYLVGILERCMAPRVVIAELRRALREGGRVLISQLADLMEEAGFKKVGEASKLYVYEKC